MNEPNKEQQTLEKSEAFIKPTLLIWANIGEIRNIPKTNLANLILKIVLRIYWYVVL